MGRTFFLFLRFRWGRVTSGCLGGSALSLSRSDGDIPKQYEASARVTFFDSAVERYLAEMAQFVILGAGFDTRAFRLPKDARVQSFEVDAPKTQAIKRETWSPRGRCLVSRA